MVVRGGARGGARPGAVALCLAVLCCVHRARPLRMRHIKPLSSGPAGADARLRDASWDWVGGQQGWRRRGAFVRPGMTNPYVRGSPYGDTPSENAPSWERSPIWIRAIGPVTGFDAFPSPTEMDAIEAIPGFSKSPSTIVHRGVMPDTLACIPCGPFHRPIRAQGEHLECTTRLIRRPPQQGHPGTSRADAAGSARMAASTARSKPLRH